MIHDRLKELRQLLHLSARAFAQEIPCSYQSYQLYEKGRKSITVDVLQAIVNRFNASLNWLLTGRGQPLLPDKGQAIEQAIIQCESYLQERQERVNTPQMTLAVMLLAELRMKYDVEVDDQLMERILALNFISIDVQSRSRVKVLN